MGHRARTDLQDRIAPAPRRPLARSCRATPSASAWGGGSGHGGPTVLVRQKIALDPTQAQATYFAKGCGVARVAWNWALEEWRRQYQAGERPAEGGLRRLLNSLRATSFPWMREVTKAA